MTYPRLTGKMNFVHRRDEPAIDERITIVSYYNEVNPPSVYETECPCANSDDGYDSRCSDHGEAVER